MARHDMFLMPLGWLMVRSYGDLVAMHKMDDQALDTIFVSGEVDP